MKLGRTSYLLGIVCAVVLASVIYILFVPEGETNKDPWRKISLKIINMLERSFIRLADASSWIENYRVRRVFQTLRTSLYRTPDNMHVEVVQIAVNGRPALHHCPEGDISKQSLPGIIYFHGGSWISGSAAEWLPLTTYLSNTSKSIVISIDYRLSPEHKFPTAFEDCLKATKAILTTPEQYGIAFRQIALAGDDVGGNLALAIALNLSREIEDDPTTISDIKLVGLFYPSLQSFDFNLPSYTRYKYGPGHLYTEDVITGTLYHLFGQNDPSLTSVMSTSRHVTNELRETKFYKDIFNTEMLPYSFQQWASQDEVERILLTNQTLQDEINNLIVDLRFSPMLVPEEELVRFPNTYFIAPEVDPKRDDSFLAYARLVEIDQSSTKHVYYSTERDGFLLDVADNHIARQALDKFGEQFNEVLKSANVPKDVETIRLVKEGEDNEQLSLGEKDGN